MQISGKVQIDCSSFRWFLLRGLRLLNNTKQPDQFPDCGNPRNLTLRFNDTLVSISWCSSLLTSLTKAPRGVTYNFITHHTSRAEEPSIQMGSFETHYALRTLGLCCSLSVNVCYISSLLNTLFFSPFHSGSNTKKTGFDNTRTKEGN